MQMPMVYNTWDSTPHPQYCNHVSDCRVQCTLGLGVIKQGLSPNKHIESSCGSQWWEMEPLSCLVTIVSKNRMVPCDSSSIVNWIAGLMGFKWWRKTYVCFIYNWLSLQIEIMSCVQVNVSLLWSAPLTPILTSSCFTNSHHHSVHVSCVVQL